ncbi:MAG: nucleotide pyrophosphohydrolase [Nitrospinae bacterium]|nr:nucleotide pyrophosphohydrolase [Nitrospinota bacterium]
MKDIQAQLRKFASEREWGKFHSPKNLAMALAVEAAEILEHFQWLTEEESAKLPPNKLAEVKDEIGDTFIYLVNLADKLGVDVKQAAREKIVKNAMKYPVEKARGRAVKHDRLDTPENVIDRR